MNGLRLILTAATASVAASSAADGNNARSCTTSLDCVWSAIAGKQAGGGGHWRCDMGTCIPIKVATKEIDTESEPQNNNT